MEIVLPGGSGQVGTILDRWYQAIGHDVVINLAGRSVNSRYTPAHRGDLFDTLLGLVKVGLGGTSGNGRQYLSWISDGDFFSALNWIIAHPALDGAVNICTPNPLPNAEFMREIRDAWGMPIAKRVYV